MNRVREDIKRIRERAIKKIIIQWRSSKIISNKRETILGIKTIKIPSKDSRSESDC